MGVARARGARQGHSVTIVAVSLTVFLAGAALTVDLGYARMVQQQLVNTSEAAARAATEKLDGTEEGLEAARAAAVALAMANPAGGVGVALDPNPDNAPDGDVVLGAWDEVAGTFTPSDDPAVVNGVRVVARDPAVGLYFAQVAFGRDATAAAGRTTTVTRVGPAGAVACYIPLALPDCIVDREGVDGLQDLTLTVNPPGVDNVGWGRANGSPNASWTRDQVLDCGQDGEASVGDPVGLQSGVVEPGLTALDTRVEDSETSWDESLWGPLPARMTGSSIAPSRYGRTYEGPILVFDGGPEYCAGSGGMFNGTETLVGFVWAAIYDVRATGPAADRSLKLRLDTRSERVVGTSAGGPAWGLNGWDPPRMVSN